MKIAKLILMVLLLAGTAAAQDLNCCQEWDKCFAELDSQQKDYIQCFGDVRGREYLKRLPLSSGDPDILEYRYPFFMNTNSCTTSLLCGLFVSACRNFLERADLHNFHCAKYRDSLQ